MRGRFTKLVGCELPLQLAPMGGICTPELVAAVTSAGAMGMTALPLAPAPVVRDALATFRGQATGPFGYNVLLPFLDRDVVDVAAQACTVVDFYHGAVDGPLVEQVHAGGALAGWQVGSTEEARAAAGAGCDLVVVRGCEGGGRFHGGRSLWPLLDEVLEAVDVPVVAAGGITTARGIAAALAAGADAVRLGTRFVATEESGAHPEYKAALVAARSTDSVLTDEFATLWPDDVKTSRVLRQSLDAARVAPEIVATMQLGAQEVKLPRFAVAPPTTAAQGDIAAMPHYAGEGVGAITSIEPAADLVRNLMVDTVRLVRRAFDAVGG
jgi:NAD(P)H-dependent flavin oxidoreductase YrpB (nitropropane dioxygenase family)